MEHHMYNIDKAVELITRHFGETHCFGLERTRKAFQHMINRHMESGSWK